MGCLAGFGSSQRDIPAEERVYRRRTEENVRVAGACVAPGPGDFLQSKPSISASREQLEEGRAAGAKSVGQNGKLDRERYSEETMRAMASIECGAAIKVRLPELLQ